MCTGFVRLKNLTVLSYAAELPWETKYAQNAKRTTFLLICASLMKSLHQVQLRMYQLERITGAQPRAYLMSGT
jgi:hypothetical protein